MKKFTKQIYDIITRYLILILVAIPNLWLFYLIFTPLTVYPVQFILGLFFDSTLEGNIITISNCCPIEIIGACIGISAYYLLLILNLSTPNINPLQRIKYLSIAFASFLILNLIRIFLLSIMFINNSAFVDITHKLFWYFLSTIFVVGIWFAEVKFFNIKEIPFYSDLKWLYKKTK